MKPRVELISRVVAPVHLTTVVVRWSLFQRRNGSTSACLLSDGTPDAGGVELDTWVPRIPPAGYVVSESDAAGLTAMQLLQRVPVEGSENLFGGFILLHVCVNQKLLDCLDGLYAFKGFAVSGGGAHPHTHARFTSLYFTSLSDVPMSPLAFYMPPTQLSYFFLFRVWFTLSPLLNIAKQPRRYRLSLYAAPVPLLCSPLESSRVQKRREIELRMRNDVRTSERASA